MLVQRGKSWRWIIDFQNCTRFNDTVFSCFRPDDFLHSGKIKLWPIVIWTICSQTLTLCRPYPSIYIPFILDWIYKVSWPKGSRLICSMSVRASVRSIDLSTFLRIRNCRLSLRYLPDAFPIQRTTSITSIMSIQYPTVDLIFPTIRMRNLLFSYNKYTVCT